MRLSLTLALMLAASGAAADWRAADWRAADWRAAVWRAAVWGAAVWGADPGAVLAAGSGARPLDPAPVFGGGLTARLTGAEQVGGLTFRALWQFDDRGLRQVLMERRGPQADPASAAALFDALIARFGPPDLRCAAPPAGGRPGAAELIWRLHGPRGGVLHAVWFDFSTTEAFARTVGDILRPFPELAPLGPPQRPEDAARDRAARRAIRGQSPDYALGGLRPSKAPRRLLLRWRDPAATRLSSRTCP